MATTFNQFWQRRAELTPFQVFHLKGKPGQLMITSVERPYARPDYYNSVNIIAGHIDCEQPDGNHVRWEAGMCDLELPPYTQAGSHRLHPGPEGVEFFCASVCCERYKGKRLKRLLIPQKAEHRLVVPPAQLVLLVSGEVELEGKVAKGPMIISPKPDPIYPIFRNAKGVVIWIDY